MLFLPSKTFFNKIAFLEFFDVFLNFLGILIFVFTIFLFYFGHYFSALFFLIILFWSIVLRKFFHFLFQIKSRISLEEFLANSQNLNALDFVDYSTFKTLKKSIKKAEKYRLKEVPLPLIIFYLFQELPKDFRNFVFARALIDSKSYFKELKSFVLGLKKETVSETSFQNCQELITQAGKIALERGHRWIRIEDFFSASVYLAPFLKHYLVLNGLKPRDIKEIIEWYLRIQKRIRKRKDFFKFENLLRLGSIGKDWASGFTPTLDLFSIDWTKTVSNVDFEDFPGHDEELRQIEGVLSKKESNNDVLLVGRPGSFRRNIIRKLALKLALGLSSKELNYKRLVELKLGMVISQAESEEELENLLSRIFSEVVKAGNIILVISNFHNYFSQSGKLGSVDISQVLTQYLRLRDFNLIGITTYKDYYRVFDKRTDVLPYFEKVEVDEFSEAETLEILENQALALEQEYKKFIPFKSLRDLLYYSEKYLAESPFPKKALDLLEEVVVYVTQNTQSPIVTSEHVAKVIQQKTEIPVGRMEETERKKLLELEGLIHQQIINQDQAVREISEALRRVRSGVFIKRGPIGSFMFLGPTGVGKTETAKALARIYFGGEERMIRFDMSEFQKREDLDRLIGSPRYEGRLVTEVKNNPFSLILLDEIEKAHSDILNLFLQILDEGYCRDSFGEKVHFEHTMIIATSNAGYKIILEAIRKNENFDKIKMKVLDYLFQNNIFRPEFVNRFDDVIIFKPLTRENLIDIAGLLLGKLQKKLRQKDISLVVTRELKEKIVDLSYNPVFGAREMRRVIQSKIEDVLAGALLKGEIKPGDSVKISPVDFQVIKVKELISRK